MLLPTLKKLCALDAAPGFEHDVRNYLIHAWKNFLDGYEVDGMGNLIGFKSAQSDKKPLTVLVMAHMDEVGLIVRDITPDGYIHFDVLGGQINEALASQLWTIHTPSGPIGGYSGMESGHTMASYPPTEKPDQHQYFIDVGASSREEVLAMGIRTGLSITYAGPSYIDLGQRILAKALDDRFGLAVISELLAWIDVNPEKQQFDLYVAATTQEEVGMRGAEVVYNSLPTKPDIVLNLDIGLARDYPLLFSQKSNKPATSNLPALGQGLTITTHDSNMVADAKLVDYLISLCSKEKLPYQLDSTILGSTDACRLQRAGKGLPSVNLGIPVRYTHSHLGMMDGNDYNALTDMLCAFCKTYNLDQHNALYGANSFTKTGFFALPFKNANAVTTDNNHQQKMKI